MTRVYKIGSFLLFLLISLSMLSQNPVEEVVAIAARPDFSYQNLTKKKTAASVNLPFFDDFSYNSTIPKTSLWEDAQVYVNQTLGTAPPTLGVATFDGLNQFGRAYDITRIGTVLTDRLTSRCVNLSNTVDSTYLSFFWQAGGRGEKPEGQDSLHLQFFNRADSAWKRIWGAANVDSTGFEQVMIPVDTAYLTDSFQFRFESFGAPAGAFDIWNIDYVRLDDQRTFADTLFTDIAFTRPHPSLLKGYEAIPWFHYSPQIANLQNRDFVILYYQRNIGPSATLNPNLCVYQIEYQGTILDRDPSGDPTKDNSHNNFVETPFSADLDPFPLPAPPVDEFEITAIQTYTGVSTSSKGPNDSVVKVQTFKNYYAYDDGTAERAYQVRDNTGGFIISKYDILQSDSIKGMYLYFLPAQYNAEDNEFKIVIYQNNGGVPGNLIYESDSVYTPEYSERDFYLPYILDTSFIVVNGPIFMGIKQLKNTRLPIGLDVNTGTKTTTFYGTPNNLFQTFVQGNLMMRPFLRYLPRDLSHDEFVVEKLQTSVFPNPARDVVYLEISDNENWGFQLFSLGGKMVQSGKATRETRLDPHLQNGFYILKIQDVKGRKSPFTTKILLQK